MKSLTKKIKKRKKYVPQFPEIYKALLEVYMKAMCAKEDSQSACMAAKFFIRCLLTLKHEGVLPIFFMKKFRLDIEEIRDTVHKKASKSKPDDFKEQLPAEINFLCNTFHY